MFTGCQDHFSGQGAWLYKDTPQEVVIQDSVFSRKGTERVIRYAYELARKENKTLTSISKGNALNYSVVFWDQIFQEVGREYPDVETHSPLVDAASMFMVKDPSRFQVVVTSNLFGDILTDEGSCITGSMGLLPSASTGEHTPVFEPIHGSWPQAKGLNIANPLAQVLSVAMLFEYFDLKKEGELIRKAVDASLDQNVRTPEIQVAGGAKYGTKEVGAWLVDWIKKA